MRTDNQDVLLKVLEMETSRISNLDSTIFTIKGWTITLVSALVGFSFTSANTGGFVLSKVLLGIAVFSTLIFMIIDLQFRNVQLGHVDTTITIKNLLIKMTPIIAETREPNIWQRVWGDKSDIKRQDDAKLAHSPQSYFFTVLLSGIVVIILIYLMGL